MVYKARREGDRTAFCEAIKSTRFPTFPPFSSSIIPSGYFEQFQFLEAALRNRILYFLVKNSEPSRWKIIIVLFLRGSLFELENEEVLGNNC